jgi:hypothetical protein
LQKKEAFITIVKYKVMRKAANRHELSAIMAVIPYKLAELVYE